jgi:hypothetical protein
MDYSARWFNIMYNLLHGVITKHEADKAFRALNGEGEYPRREGQPDGP